MDLIVPSAIRESKTKICKLKRFSEEYKNGGEETESLPECRGNCA
jgi:hypothetical protein